MFIPSNITSAPADIFIPIFVNVRPISLNITPSFANIFDSISPIYQLTITPRPAQIGLTLPANLLEQVFNTYANSYTQIPSIKMLNKMLFAPIVAQFVKIKDKNSNYIGKI